MQNHSLPAILTPQRDARVSISREGSHGTLIVIPGRGKAANPEPMNTS
jgi:hypothetical protein